MKILVVGGRDDFIAGQSFKEVDRIHPEWRSTFVEGVTYLTSHPVDALVLDSALADQATLLLHLDQIQTAYPALPILVRGEADEEAALEILRHGAQDYLVKGVDSAAVLTKSLRCAVERQRRSEQLRHAEAHQDESHFRSAFTYASIGMAIVGLDGRWLQVNPALCHISGYPEAELLATTFQKITHPDDLNADLNYVRQLIAGEIQTYQMEKRYFHKQGHEIWVFLSVSLVRSANGRPLHFISQIQDVTQRKHAEAQLQTQMRESQMLQDYLQALHEITIELTNISSLDAFYRRSVEFGLERLGFDRLGLLLYDMESGLANGTYGTDAQGNVIPEHHIQLDPTALTGILTRALNKEERFVIDEHTELFSDSESIGIGWNAVAILWNGRQKLGWLAIDNGIKHLPISQNQLNILALYAVTLGALLADKQAEFLLKQERDLLRTVIDSLPDFIFIKDLAGRFVLSNRAIAHASRLTPDEMIGKTVYDILPVELANQVQADEEQVIATGMPLISVERTVIGRNGESRTVLGSKVPLYNHEGKMVSLLGISHDITERKQLETQTAELEAERWRSRLLQRFVGDMSHDFRTPLSVINSSLYLLQKSTDPQKQQLYAKRAEQQVIRLDKLLEELLLMQHLDDQLNLQLALTDINMFLKPIMEDYAIPAAAKHISISYLPSAEPCFAEIDTVELGRAITKLLDNAILYSPEGGQINVRTQKEAQTVVIAVQDTGIGIDANDLPHIFERFYRADEARSTSTGGSGVGLSIVQKVVQAHNGRIEVASIVGKGSTFSITLPKP